MCVKKTVSLYLCINIFFIFVQTLNKFIMREYTFAFYKDENFKLNKSFRAELKSDAFRQADIYMQNHDFDDWEILED